MCDSQAPNLNLQIRCKSDSLCRRYLIDACPSFSPATIMVAQNHIVTLITVTDPPTCPLPALLGPAKQSACFSICNERLVVDSSVSMRYFSHPPMNSNLRDGLREFMNLPLKDRSFQRARRLDNIFTTCLQSAQAEELQKAEIVTWRGILCKPVVLF